MTKFKLSRDEKLILVSLPALTALWLWVLPLVAVGSMDRTLRRLAGPQAVDCGVSYVYVAHDPCAIAAFKAGQPFLVRDNLNPSDEFHMNYMRSRGLVRTPQGQIYLVDYSREHQGDMKIRLSQSLLIKAGIGTDESGRQRITFDYSKNLANKKSTWVWW